MPTCPNCHQPVSIKDINCPHCQTLLKAFGHPGIPLHQARDNTYLCNNCLYHEDDSCNFPQRPYATTCTLYHDKSQPIIPDQTFIYSPSLLSQFKSWCRRNQGLLLLIGLILISFILVFIKR